MCDRQIAHDEGGGSFSPQTMHMGASEASGLAEDVVAAARGVCPGHSFLVICDELDVVAEPRAKALPEFDGSLIHFAVDFRMQDRR